MQLLSLAALVLPAYVCAQYGFDPSTQPSTTAPPPSLPSNIHQVMLGVGNGLTFSPNTLTAKQGDIVVFTISTQTSFQHGVVQTTADSPCVPLANGYDSGLVSPGSSFAVTVNTTDPLFLYCPQTAPAVHCEMGMVMIINPAAPADITSLSAAAAKVTNEPTATTVQSSGSNVVGTTVPTQISGSGSSGSGGNKPNGALKTSAATTAGLLIAVVGLFFAMA